MAIEQTKTARNLSSGQVIEPQLILEIEGIVGTDGANLLFSTSDVLVPLAFDALPPYEFDNVPPHYFDSGVKSRNSRDYISWKNTSKSIKNQILIEKGGAGSVQNFKVELINKARELTELFSSGNYIDDIFGQRCELYLSYVGAVHPTDSQLIFQGIIKGISQAHGNLTLDIAHPDQLKRQELFSQASTNLIGALDDISTSVTVENAGDFVVPTVEQQALGFKSYIKINDEYMQIVSRNLNTFEVLRNQLESASAIVEIDDEADVTSHFRLTEQPIEMMMRLMLSNGNGSSYLDLDVDNFVRNDVNDIGSSIWFQGVDVFKKYQILSGDTISSVGAINATNNFVDRKVLEIVNIPEGSYIIVDGAELLPEVNSTAQISIVSQYNLYPIGLGMLPKDIDMTAILETKNEVDLGLPQISIDIDEEINVKEFMEKELAKPCALYFIPTARVSVKFTRPPLAGEKLVELNPDTIANIQNLKIDRSFGSYFYNAITYKYEFNPVKDKHEQYRARLNTDSLGRVGLGRKALTVSANGFRAGGDVVNIINSISRRILDRYKFGARYIKGVQVLWRESSSITIGDVVNMVGVKIPDLETGSDEINDILFEVINKTTTIKDGKITLDLLETSFGATDRFATTAPSSNVVSALSSNSVLIKQSFSTSGSKKEKDKWQEYISGKVELHNVDYTVSQVLTLTGFRDGNENEAEFLEPLTITPDGLVMDFAPYDDCNSRQKLLHTFIGPVTDITSGISDSVFDCDTTNLFIGDTIIIRRSNFTESNESTIIDISGNTVTTKNSIGFTPDNTDKVESGMPSDQKPFYRFV